MILSTDILIIIDVQKDFCSGGALEVPDGETVVEVINRLSPRANAVALTQDWHPPSHFSFASNHDSKQPYDVIQADYGEQVLWPDHCVQTESGADFHEDLDTSRAQLVVRKGFRPELDSYSAFQENDRQTSTGLAGYLQDRKLSHVYLCGLATDFCVAWSALDARALGFDVTVISDACQAIDLNGSLDASISDMAAANINFTTASQILSRN